MPLFDWIHSNLHDLNLDWIINKIKNVETAEANSAASAADANAAKVAAAGSATAANNSKVAAAGSATSAAASAQTAQNLVDQLDTTIAADVETWLNTHVTPTSPIVDDTLTIQGAAADAKKTGDEITDLKTAIGNNTIALSERYNAVISGSNVWSTNTNGSSQCVAIAVNGGETLEITHRSNITFHLAFLKTWSAPVSGEAPDFCDGYASRIVIAVSDVTTTRIIPADCRYVYILVNNNNVDYSPLHFIINNYDVGVSVIDGILGIIASDNETLTNEIDAINNQFEGSETIDSFTLIDGYVNYNTGGISLYSGDGKYKRTDYIELVKSAKIESNFTSNAEAGFAFYNAEKVYISGGSTYPATVPHNAKYVILSNFSNTATHTGLYANLIYIPVVAKTIACFGDSVTEGMGMTSANTAVYGGDNYPSHLLTMLTDNNVNAKVYNYGHGGERSTETCARIGGRICGYLSEDITIPASNAAQSLGVAIVSNYKVSGSKLYSTGRNADGTTAQILFTKLGFNTRPLMIGDRLCNIYQAQQDGGIIQTINLVSPTGEDTTIPALSSLTVGSTKRDADIYVVYMGINDGSNITLTEWIDRCKSVIERNPKTLILGSTNHNWTFWQGMTGTDAEKRATYLNACLAAFGSYYLDLYDILTTDKCIKIAQNGGYLTDRTAEQIAADNAAISNRQTPPSITLEGTAGEVHLNNIGYYVLAKSVYEKLMQLGLL